MKTKIMLVLLLSVLLILQGCNKGESTSRSDKDDDVETHMDRFFNLGESTIDNQIDENLTDQSENSGDDIEEADLVQTLDDDSVDNTSDSQAAIEEIAMAVIADLLDAYNQLDEDRIDMIMGNMIPDMDTFIGGISRCDYFTLHYIDVTDISGNEVTGSYVYSYILEDPINVNLSLVEYTIVNRGDYFELVSYVPIELDDTLETCIQLKNVSLDLYGTDDLSTYAGYPYLANEPLTDQTIIDAPDFESFIADTSTYQSIMNDSLLIMIPDSYNFIEEDGMVNFETDFPQTTMFINKESLNGASLMELADIAISSFGEKLTGFEVLGNDLYEEGTWNLSLYGLSDNVDVYMDVYMIQSNEDVYIVQMYVNGSNGLDAEKAFMIMQLIFEEMVKSIVIN